MSTNKELYKLELLSLVNRVSQELFNHTKLQDKNLAEFVIAVGPSSLTALISQLHEQSKTFDTFQSRLGEVGADFPPWFVQNLDRLIITMHPKYKKKAAKAKAMANQDGNIPEQSDEKALQTRKFPGLSLPDKEVPDKEGTMEKDSGVPLIDVDDTMAELAAVASRRNRPTAEDFLEGEPSSKRQKAYPDSGPSRPLRDNGYASRNERNGNYGNGSYSNGDHHYSNGDSRGRSGRTSDPQPILYKIYDGTIQGIRDFGAFVSLEGIEGRVEGEQSW